MANEKHENAAIGENSNNVRVQPGSEGLSLHSSDHPGMILVSTVLDGKNYLSWSRAVKRALCATKLGFITGACVKPTKNSDLMEQWTRADNMVTLWLLNAMHKNISSAFMYAKSARDLWIELEERYGECNGPLLYQLQREISSATQGEMSIIDYFTKIKMLWDELVLLTPLPECTCGCECTCGITKATADLLEQNHLMQFLMGLNEEYDNVRNQILVMDPLPTVNRAYSMILRVEKQRQIHMHLSDVQEGAALFARNYDKKKDDYSKTGGYKRKLVHDKRNLRCENCNKLGHDKSTCFKIYGVPDWYEELNDQRKKNSAGNNRVHAVMHGKDKKEYKEQKNEDKGGMTEMMMEIMKMLKSKLPADPIQVNCADEYAGMHFTFSGTDYMNRGTWIIDSDATSHMCIDSCFFHNLHTSQNTSIHPPDGTLKHIT